MELIAALIAFSLLFNLTTTASDGGVVVFIREICLDGGPNVNKDGFLQYLSETGKEIPETDFEFLSYDDLCKYDIAPLLLEKTWSPRVLAMVGSLEMETCELISRVAAYKRKPFLTWSCSQMPVSEPRLLPSLEEVASSVVLAIDTMKRKSVLVLYSEIGQWSKLSDKIVIGLMELSINSRHIYITDSSWKQTFVKMKSFRPKVVIVCASNGNESRKRIIKYLDNYSINPSLVLIVDLLHLDFPSYDLVHNVIRDKNTIDSSTFRPSDRSTRQAHDTTQITFNTLNNINVTTTSYQLTKLNDTSNHIITMNKHNELMEENITQPNIQPLVATKSLPSSIKKNHNEKVNRHDDITNKSNNKTIIVKGINVRTNYDSKTQLSNINKQEYKNIHHRSNINKTIKSAYKTESDVIYNRLTAINQTLNDVNSGATPIQLAQHSENKVREEKHTGFKYSDKNLFKLHVRENFKYKRRKRNSEAFSVDEYDYISSNLKNSLLVMKLNNSLEIKQNITNVQAIYKNIYECLKILENNDTIKINTTFSFLFYDHVLESSGLNLLRIKNVVSKWRPIISIDTKIVGSDIADQTISLNVWKLIRDYDVWLMDKFHNIVDDDCVDDSCVLDTFAISSFGIAGVIAVSFVASTFLAGFVIFIRNIVSKRKLSKRPNKVILQANDFVFPQVSEGRRVDEGMEAMLCCWLQQLQEFGGPEVDKPDLIKGSVASLKGLGANMNTGSGNRGPSSNASIVRNNHIVDPRTRYNGDLVQMKYFPNVGNFELKRKANDILQLLHSLRHENLNPFIGCLCEPSMPALVFEYCNRGSLEDVLIADEIKLDWTFRLSLLTDLVRGMRYLHSTAVRAHGFLTSRNCIVDSRWVLKVTDYGLPSFYKAQGIIPPPKPARDLLWTAPEILRELSQSPAFIPFPTQAGDVYSFAIVMQEVVVRGEPFCMLSLSPEEIIEKVKRPPPLIRPSVSKGAAPPEAINIMRQCWTENPDMRPDFNAVHDLFRKLNQGRKVNFIDTMFEMLEKYSNNLEELIKERTEQLDMEKKKTEQLLARMLPSYVAEKLKLGMPVDPEEFSEVSIYFSDIVGFTSISAHSSPFQVVDLLNDLYTCFDATINAYNVYKVETIGDAYMVVSGLPVRIPDHAVQIANMALELLYQSGRFKIRHLPRTPLRLRIGLHTGPCCAGVVGLTMPRYCLFGDTVNTASRMESTGAAWRIHMSSAIRDKLEAVGGYRIQARGLTHVKGKGSMHTFWLLGRDGFDKALPPPPPIELEESLIIERTNLSVSNSLLNKSEENSSDCSLRSSPRPPMCISPRIIHSLSDDARQALSPDSSEVGDKISFEAGRDTWSDKISISGERIIKVEEASAQQIVEMRKMNYSLKHDVSIRQNDIYQRKQNNSRQNTIVRELDLEVGNGDCKYDSSSAKSPDDILVMETAKLILNAKPRDPNKDAFKTRRSTLLEHDLSMPYNNYKCLSPSDSNINQSGRSVSFYERNERPGSVRLLKRQFSLDKADDLISEGGGKLCKQNSAGAAHDLAMIEEIPTRRLSRFEPNSISVESLPRIWNSGR